MEGDGEDGKKFYIIRNQCLSFDARDYGKKPCYVTLPSRNELEECLLINFSSRISHTRKNVATWDHIRKITKRK